MNIFFMWIPKTGGTSLHHALLQLVTKPHAGGSWTQNPGLPELDFQDGSDYFTGHWPATMIDRLPENTLKVSLIRDPIDRVISHYNYVHAEGYHYDPEYTEFCKQATFREWLDSDYTTRAANNLMTRFFGNRLDCNIETALATLNQFDFVGVLENGGLYFTTRYVATHLGKDMNQVVIGHYRESPKTITRSELSPTLLGELRERHLDDYVLYDAVKEKWPCDIRHS